MRLFKNSRCDEQAELFDFDLYHCVISLVLKILYSLITNEYIYSFRAFRVKSKEDIKRRRSEANVKIIERPTSEAGGHLVNASSADEVYSLSDIREADIQVRGRSDNHASVSMQSFASDFQGVDLPVFDDSQNNETSSPNDIALGE